MDEQSTLFERNQKPETEIPLIRRIFIGVDPGSSKGAITAFIYPPNGVKMTRCLRISKVTEKDTSDFIQELSILKNKDEYSIHTIFEKVGVMPDQGIVSAFKFGHHTGLLKGLLLAHNIPFEEKTPQTWIKSFGMKKDKNETQTSWKNRLKGRAQQLFPDHKFTLEECDSFLIAEYCKTFYKN